MQITLATVAGCKLIVQPINTMPVTVHHRAEASLESRTTSGPWGLAALHPESVGITPHP